MQIINNRTADNHGFNLLKLFKNADEAIIVSPFLSKSFNFFDFKENTHLRKITLITTLKNDYYDQICKLNFFKKLFSFGSKESVEIEILIDNTLHGKIYIFKKGNEFIDAIITSANFTANGLRLNNEWGIKFNDKVKIEEIAVDLVKNIVLKPISENDLISLEIKLNSITPPEKEKLNSVNLVDELKFKTNPLSILPNANYWLKPIGSTDNFISLSEKYSASTSDLYFAKKPVGVKIGDILIAYAVGYKKVLSIFKVISSIKLTANTHDRWHYFIEAENLTRHYGNEWNSHHIHISSEKNNFISSTNLNATPSGKNSFGSLQRGGDKLRITRDFGDYIIDQTLKINKDISFSEENI